VNRQLLLGQANSRFRRAEIGKEELQQPQVAQLGRLTGWTVEPGRQRVSAGVGNREHAPASTVPLATLGHESLTGQARRHGVQQGVREGPEVAQRRLDVALHLVRRRRPFAREQAEDQVRGRRQSLA
jgi:hypothetical protein